MFHYNKHSGRAQAQTETKTEEKRYSILYPKYRSGGYIARKITTYVWQCSTIAKTVEEHKHMQAETKTGEKRYSIMYPKYKLGGYIGR